MDIKRAGEGDLIPLLRLYTQLHDNSMPQINDDILELWDSIIKDRNHHVFVGLIEAKLIASCVMLIVPNLTHNQRPYAVIENVITDEAHRGKGYATQLLNFAKETAQKHNCYKMMLMTGSKKESTWRFYERAGYNRMDKTAFIRWLH